MKRTIIGAVAVLVWASALCVIAQEDAPPARPDVVPTVPGATVQPTVPQPPAPRTADVPPPTVPPPPMVPQADVPQADAGSSAPVPEAGYLGVIGDDRNDRGRGVRVVEVRPGGPANLAGLLPGDLIVGVSGVRVRQMSDMVAIIQQARPGTTLALDVHRNNERRNVHVTLAHRPAVQQGPDLAGGLADNPPGTKSPARPPDPFRLDAPRLPPKSTEDSARLELLEQRLDRLETRMEKMERAMLDLLKALKSR